METLTLGGPALVLGGEHLLVSCPGQYGRTNQELREWMIMEALQNKLEGQHANALHRAI